MTIIDEGFAKFTKDEMAARLDAQTLAWAPVQTLAEVATDPQTEAAGAIVQVPSTKGDGSTFASPASPVRFPGADDGPKGPSPKLGEHSREILGAMGLDAAAIDALYADKIVR